MPHYYLGLLSIPLRRLHSHKFCITIISNPEYTRICIRFEIIAQLYDSWLHNSEQLHHAASAFASIQSNANKKHPSYC